MTDTYVGKEIGLETQKRRWNWRRTHVKNNEVTVSMPNITGVEKSDRLIDPTTLLPQTILTIKTNKKQTNKQPQNK